MKRIDPSDYDHLIVACLLHDIGYMRGVLSGEAETEFVVDASGRKVTLTRGSSDAALSPSSCRSKFDHCAGRLARLVGFAAVIVGCLVDADERIWMRRS